MAAPRDSVLKRSRVVACEWRDWRQWHYRHADAWRPHCVVAAKVSTSNILNALIFEPDQWRAAVRNEPAEGRNKMAPLDTLTTVGATVAVVNRTTLSSSCPTVTHRSSHGN